MELEINMAEKCNPIDIKVIGLNTQGLKSNVPYVTNFRLRHNIFICWKTDETPQLAAL